MITVNSIAGNILADRNLNEQYQKVKAAGKRERLLVSRTETERLRLRRKTDRGTDVGLVLEPGSRLHHGDVLATTDKFIIVEQLPEKVLTVSILEKKDFGKMVSLAALIGHTIGNRHRPIAIDLGTISFPLQAESEVDTFRKLLPAGVKIKVNERVFIPTGEAHSHE